MKPEGAAVLSRKGEDRVLRGHPWVFRSDIARVSQASDGAVVRVEGSRGRVLGFALYSSRSEIRLRMIERGEALADSWLRDRLEAAIRWRETVAAGASACRLVHGEGDGLPSLVVDRYGDYLVIQTLSQGTERLKSEIVAALVERLQPKGMLERNDPRVRSLEGLDQRENHLMARSYTRGRVLDGFTYSGGFALSVARAAEQVIAVDLSADALARVQSNAARNGIGNVETRDANVFDLLHELDKKGERFQAVILDPPAFAKSKDAVEKAWRGYKEINLRALKVLDPGGCLITCSCSYHVHESDLEEILTAAAVDAGATVTVVEKRRQARDHPVVLGVPETYYLKCFVLRKLS